MMKIRLSILLLIFLVAGFGAKGQTGAETYVWPKDAKVLENLKKWQGEKFGLLIHLGLYSQLGTVESWGLCPEDWVTRDGYDDYYKYATDYRNTKKNFNPVNFDPEKWARAFKGSGAKYVIYSTKHHDGFCLFDSKYTNFKVTDKDCPFSSNPKSNIAKEVFNACRKEGLSVGAYFSKPDWTTPYFWWPNFPPKDRNPSYDITKYPDRWKKYVEYTQNQLNEIVSDYGKLDILWLDGCWVRPLSTINKSVEEFCKYPYDMDIDMKKIAANAREKQPGMLIVDRWVPSEYEDYLTPEQKTSEKALTVPWESCITMGGAWGWVPNDNYKSTRELVQLLIKIVAKGGNLLLGVGPNGKGEFEPALYDRLQGMGQWLSQNSNAIYETVPVAPFQEGNIAYTAKGDNTVFALYMPDKDEAKLPAFITVKTTLKGRLKITLPAYNQKLKAIQTENTLQISIPESLRLKLVKDPAVVIQITK
ncbi:MAG: alpha-L-fucosidase [Bacteroidetes bacterium]|nr:alpha-L-fucosidase [Bacteroidota bacterium]